MGHSTSKDQISEYRPEFEVLRVIDTPNYGRAKLVRENATNSSLILKDFIFDTKEAFEDEVAAFEDRAAFDHPNIIQILGYYVSESSQLCSSLFKVSVFIESLPKDLETEIKERQAAKTLFHEQEVLIIADCAVSALHHFQTKGLSHGDVRPANIFIDGQIYKITDPKLEVDQNANGVVKAALGQSKTLLTPSLVKQVPISDFEIVENNNKADVFALGATLLNVATLEKSEDLYNYQTGTFNEELLHKRLDLVSQMYSPFTASLIRDMLQVDEAHRPDFVALKNHLYNFSRQHNLPQPTAKGWEEGRFYFVGPTADSKKPIDWKYKQETRLAHEMRAKGEAHRILEDEKNREREQKEREKQEALKKKEEALQKKEEEKLKKEEERLKEKERKEELKREKEHNEKVKKSALPPQEAHVSGQHAQESHPKKTVEPIVTNTAVNVAQQNSYNPQAWNNNNRTNIEQRDTFGSQNWNFNSNQNNQATYNQNVQANYNQSYQPNYSQNYNQNFQPNYSQNVQVSNMPGHIGFPDQPAVNDNVYQPDSTVKTTFVQYNNQRAVESPLKSSYPTAYGGVNNNIYQQPSSPTKNTFIQYNNQQAVESPLRSSYQGSYGGAMERPSRVKQLNEYTKEENIASYNYTLGGSPLRQRNSRSPDGTLRSSAVNNLLQGQGVYSPVKQTGLPDFIVPVNKNDSPFKNLYN